MINIFIWWNSTPHVHILAEEAEFRSCCCVCAICKMLNDIFSRLLFCIENISFITGFRLIQYIGNSSCFKVRAFLCWSDLRMIAEVTQSPSKRGFILYSQQHPFDQFSKSQIKRWRAQKTNTNSFHFLYFFFLHPDDHCWSSSIPPITSSTTAVMWVNNESISIKYKFCN